MLLRFLYPFIIQLYRVGIGVAALWNDKAAQWQKGRAGQWPALAQTFSKPHSTIWIHSASAGEFEQAKPLIEALKKGYPAYRILVTVFSPSGYGPAKKFAGTDELFYLPLDTRKNAERFVETVQPALVIFIKYDYWYYHLKAVHRRHIPLLLVSAIFRPDQIFFKSAFYRRLLHFFTQLFVQDETSQGLLKKAGVNNVAIAGDTRFDRVQTIAANATPLPLIDAFIGPAPALVCGSTWPADEAHIYGLLKKFPQLKIILAPHQTTPAHLANLDQLFQNPIRYSALREGAAAQAKARVLIIDNMGMLSRLYRYAAVAYVGGGFKKSGIHNTLEAAVFGKPVIIGPNFEKFREAGGLVAAGAAFSYTTLAQLEQIVEKLLGDNGAREKSGAAAAAYVSNGVGATQKVMHYIQEKRLLTSV